MFGRRLRSPMDYSIRPDIGATAQQKQDYWPRGQVKLRDFYVGDLVYEKNYASGPTWLPGRIKGKCGNVMFEVDLENGRCVRKHIDQLISRYESTEPVSSGSNDMESFEEPVTQRESQVALETTSDAQETMEDATSRDPPLPMEQDSSDSTEDSTDSTTSNTTVDDTTSVPNALRSTSY